MRRKPPRHLPAGRRPENRRRHPETQRHPLRRQTHLLSRPALPCAGNPQKISHHVPIPRHPLHHLPAPRRHRPRVRISAYCFSAHLGRVGSRRHRCACHPQQERISYETYHRFLLAASAPRMGTDGAHRTSAAPRQHRRGAGRYDPGGEMQPAGRGRGDDPRCPERGRLHPRHPPPRHPYDRPQRRSRRSSPRPDPRGHRPDLLLYRLPHRDADCQFMGPRPGGTDDPSDGQRGAGIRRGRAARPGHEPPPQPAVRP